MEFTKYHYSLVQILARQFHRKNPSVDYDDLFQEGFVCLWENCQDNQTKGYYYTAVKRVMLKYCITEKAHGIVFPHGGDRRSCQFCDNQPLRTHLRFCSLDVPERNDDEEFSPEEIRTERWLRGKEI